MAAVADISKMYNSIYIDEVEQHYHRFLWRNLDFEKPPDTYAILRVNMGGKPAGVISTEAIYLTAEMHQKEFPKVAHILRSSTCVYDIVVSVSDLASAVKLATDTNSVLSSAGFDIKHWLFSGEQGVRTSPDKPPNVSEGDKLTTKVLGVSWSPERDMISIVPALNFSSKRRGVCTKPDLLSDQAPNEIPPVLTRRTALERTMRIYDPFGFLAPFTLIAKYLLRKTWALGLSWDEPLADNLRAEWIELFCQLFKLSDVGFDRSLTPENRVEEPMLIILSDGSDLAYGFAAYIRWTLDDGSYWCRLVMAKCRIAPMHKRSTPHIELNGAVAAAERP